MAGSVLPFYDAYARTLMIGDEEYIVKGFLREVGIESLRELLIQYALMFYNAPYRWGGRTPNGVDGAGLVQMVYRLAGIAIPRYIDQQAGAGQVLSFLEEAQPGDLAFFGDSSGAVTHVGILWEQGRIIHASGKVRVDKIDHPGYPHSAFFSIRMRASTAITHFSVASSGLMSISLISVANRSSVDRRTMISANLSSFTPFCPRVP